MSIKQDREIADLKERVAALEKALSELKPRETLKVKRPNAKND